MNRKSIIKTMHILCACMWVGTAMSIILLHCARGWSENYPQVAALNQNFSLMDFALIIPGAMGSTISGLWICRTTSWGLYRYWWVIAKGLATLFAIVIGTVLLSPWQMQLVKLSGMMARAVNTGSAYGLVRILFTLVSFFQVLLLVFIIFLSVRKPWGRRLSRLEKAASVKRGAVGTIL